MDKNRLMRKSFDLGSASLVFLVAFGAQLVFQLIVVALGLSDAAKTWTIVIGNQLVLLAVTLAFCFGKKVDFLEITGLRRPPRWYYFPLFILIAFACVATFAPLAGVFSHLLSKLGYEVTGGTDSPYLWVNVKGDSWEFFDKLLKEANVVTTPGAGFGRAGEGFIRISAFNSRENVLEAIDRLSSVLA